jgi:MoxR-like ATPase
LYFFSGGHALLVGVPGLAKTLLVKYLGRIRFDFKRIQFTPDLMPSDILGSEILDESRQFKFIRGQYFLIYSVMKLIGLRLKLRQLF